MSNSTEYLEYLGEQLEPLGAVGLRRMFGGSGVFYGALMFGLVTDDTLYFKAGELNRSDYEAAGSEPFSYARQGRRRIAMSYYRVPDDVLEDGDALVAWGQKAIDAALAAARDKKKPKRKTAGPA